MDFYFCETCGKRLTNVDLEQGSARNKQVKGVYCQQCAVGVMTVEFDAIKYARPEPPATPSSDAATFVKSPQAFGKGSARTLRKAASPQRTGVLLPAIGVAAMLIAGLLIFLTASGKRDASDTAKSSVAGISPPPPSQSVVKPPEATHDPDLRALPNPPEILEPAVPSKNLEVAAPPQNLDTEALAVKDFEKLTRFDGLAADDKTGRIAAVEEFLKTHSETIVAARARALIADFQKSEVPVQVAEKTEAPPQTPAVAKTDTPADDVEVERPKSAEIQKQPPPSATLPKPDLKDNGKQLKLKNGMREYTLTFQQGHAIPEGSIDKYDGCASSSISVQEPKPYGRCPDLFGGEQAHLCLMTQFYVFAREGGMLPNDAEIVEARLSIYKRDDYACTFELHRIQRPWKDNEVTWKWAAKGDPWKSPGGDLDAKAAANLSSPEKAGWCDLDIAESLRDAQKDGKNFGWRSWVVCPGICHFASSYYKDETLRPKLVLKVRCAKLRGDKQ